MFKFLSAEGFSATDCRSVSFGSPYNSKEGVISRRLRNGDIKLYDLKTIKVCWSKYVKIGMQLFSLIGQTFPWTNWNAGMEDLLF